MKLPVIAVSAIFLLSSCSKTAGGGQHANVQLRDGTSVTGTVISSSPSEIQIAGEDKAIRTIPMTQVRSIAYDDAPPAVPAGNPPSASAPAQASAPAPAPAKLAHREHYHPRETAITSK